MEDKKPTFYDIYYKEYYEKNKDKIKKIQNEYKEKNIDKIKQYRKEYYQKNKDKMKNAVKNKHHCDICNVDVSHFPRHIQTSKHLNNIDKYVE